MQTVRDALTDPDHPGRPSEEYKPIYLNYPGQTPATKAAFWAKLRKQFRRYFRKERFPSNGGLPGQ